MVREEKKEEAERYLNKGKSFYSAALEEFAKERYDVSVFSASQAIILTNDALCIAFLGKRPSKDHREAIELHLQASAGKKNKKEDVKDALEKRGKYGYTEKTASKEEARKFLITTKRFLDWIEEKIGK